jgi:curved DNA-binding protein CbpA
MAAADPYKTLGVRAGASDEEIRRAYRRLVQLHHPDHNHGSEESERRFEEIQAAYARIRSLRAGGAPKADTATPPRDPGVDSRLAEMERELREAQRIREQAQAAERAARAARDDAARAAREAREATGDGGMRRASDEELGYITTDDSLSKILADARDELADRFGKAREHPVVRRVSDLIDELDSLTERSDRDRRPRDR